MYITKYKYEQSSIHLLTELNAFEQSAACHLLHETVTPINELMH